MKAYVINAQKTYGRRKSDGSPYEMHIVTIGLPFSNTNTGNYNQEGYGLNTAEIPLEPSILPKFAFLNGKPALMELTTEEKIMFGEIRSVVVDAKVSSAG